MQQASIIPTARTVRWPSSAPSERRSTCHWTNRNTRLAIEVASGMPHTPAGLYSSQSSTPFSDQVAGRGGRSAATAAAG